MPVRWPSEALTVESVRFPAGRYRLEGELVYADGPDPSGAAVLAGPHPLLGGTMHNNVVRGLGDGLACHNWLTLRFNYRGTGGSEGPTADPVGQLAEFWRTSQVSAETEYQDDLAAAVAFLRPVAGTALPLALIGYSFGCSLLARVVQDEPSAALVLVAPTLGTHDYGAFETLAHPKLVIAPQGDFATDPETLTRWFHRLPAPRQLVRPRADGHFLRGYEEWLVETVRIFLCDPGDDGS